MRPCHVVAFLGLPPLVVSLEVTPNSVCSSRCDKNVANGAEPSDGGTTKTTSSDLVCNDYNYDGSTEAGQRFKVCLSCEPNSTAEDGVSNENDVYWALFHMKLTVAWCLFAFPHNLNLTLTNSLCADICSGPGNTMKSALVDRLLILHASSQYLYCADGEGEFSKATDACQKCLRTVPSSETLSRFLEALNLACDQRPSPGSLLKLDFNVFASVSDSAASSSQMVSSVTTSHLARVSSANSSSTEIFRNETSKTSSAATNHAISPLFPSATITKSIFSAATTSDTTSSSSSTPTPTAAPSQESHDNAVRMGVGVGVGLGGTAAISVAVGILIWWWRRYNLKLKNEAHDRRKAGFRIRHWQDQPRPVDAKLRSAPKPQAPGFVTGADVLPHPTELRLSQYVVEDTVTPRTTQTKEPDFFIVADVVPPMRESQQPVIFEADNGIVRR